MKIFLLLTFSYFFVFSSYSQKSADKNKMPGTYQFFSSDSLFRLTIVLKNDLSFSYDIVNDLTEKSSAGSWKVIRDTLILNTYSPIDHFKIKVKEIETSGSMFKLGDVTTRSGVIIPTALIAINGDTTKLYDPFVSGFELHIGDVKTINVYIGRAKSEVYLMRNPRANKINVIVDMDQNPNDYMFMKNAMFLVSGDKIYPLRDNRIDSIATGMNENRPITLVKGKNN